MKLFSAGSNVGDNVGDVAKDGGEYEQANHELSDLVDAVGFAIRVGMRGAPNCGQGECAPVEGFEV